MWLLIESFSLDRAAYFLHEAVHHSPHSECATNAAMQLPRYLLLLGSSGRYLKLNNIHLRLVFFTLRIEKHIFITIKNFF